MCLMLRYAKTMYLNKYNIKSLGTVCIWEKKYVFYKDNVGYTDFEVYL